MSSEQRAEWAVCSVCGGHYDPAIGAPCPTQTLGEAMAEPTYLEGRVSTLFGAIAHGSEAHRVWLRKAIEDHFSGRPVEACAAMTDRSQSTDHLGRDAKDFAIEFGEYLAQSAKLLLTAVDIWRRAGMSDKPATLTTHDLPLSVSQGQFSLWGVTLHCHVLSDGQRIIKADDVAALFEAMSGGPPDDHDISDDMEAFARWVRGK